jgi:hypothetical protein
MGLVHLTRAIPEHAGGPLECDAQESALESYKKRGWRETGSVRPAEEQKVPQQGKKDKNFRKESGVKAEEESEGGKPEELFVPGGKE